MIAIIENIETIRHCMEFPAPDDWVEVSEPEIKKAFDTLDHRQDCQGYWYERHNGKQFATKNDKCRHIAKREPKTGWWGSPEYFKPA